MFCFFVPVQDRSSSLLNSTSSKSAIKSKSTSVLTRSSAKDEIHDEQKTPTQGDELRKLKSNWSSKHPRCATTGAIRHV